MLTITILTSLVALAGIVRTLEVFSNHFVLNFKKTKCVTTHTTSPYSKFKDLAD